MTGLTVVARDDRLDVTLDRPDRLNALTPDLLFELAKTVASVDAPVVVLHGAGSRAFSAGFDLDVLREFGAAAHDGDPLGTAVDALMSCPVPVIAVLHGHTLGAAVELAAACDLRLAHQDLRLAVPANRVGSLYRPAGIALLARRFGWATASELFTFGQELDSDLAYARGIVAFVGTPVATQAQMEGIVADLGSTPGPAAAHARFLREWAASGGLTDASRARWEAARAAAVAGRRIIDGRAR
jgi:enoyl-CoA hydratase